MNKVRRKRIQEAISKLEEAKQILEEVQVEEQDSFDNLPGSLQDSEKGEQLSDNISFLDDVVSDLDDQMGQLEEL
ncbi:hypothetical protein [Eubacterium ramulus]|mgnify:FL=1|uniref:hypothetical protein n=1 Tax=Eubacterium ramulus TaxID=39490 RepID=UPI0022E7FD21|nr:hypothetical protein [Eubacterium ramulus]